MSIINKYNNPTIINWNLDDLGEPTALPRENESKPVVGGKIALEEIPDSYRRVFIDGYMEIDLKQKIIDEFHYKVDYTNGIVFFHSSKEGQTINITRYYGRGMFYIPSSRVWSKIDDLGNVVSTLADMEGNLGEIVGKIEGISNMANSANTIVAELKANVITGTTLNTNLNSGISTGQSIRSQLDSAVGVANTSKINLDGTIVIAGSSLLKLDSSISNASTSKLNLDGSVSIGNILKNNLDSNISVGSALKNNLDTNITSGNKLKVDLPPLISSANTSKSNLDSSVSTSVSKKSDLDGSINVANSKKADLDLTVTSANTINNTLSHPTTGTIKKAMDIKGALDTTVATANSSKSALDTSVGIANTSKSNLDSSVPIANTAKQNLDSSVAEANLRKEALDAIIQGSDFETIIVDLANLKQDQHKHINKTVLDDLSGLEGKLKYKGQDVGVPLGETVSTAYRGDRGRVAYEHSQVAHAPSGSQKNSDITKVEIENKLIGIITTHSHTVTKTDVNLENVDNTADKDKPISTAMQTALDLKANISSVPTKVSQLTNDSGYLVKGLSWGALVNM